MPEIENDRKNPITLTATTTTFDAERTELLAELETARFALINTTHGLSDGRPTSCGRRSTGRSRPDRVLTCLKKNAPNERIESEGTA